MKCPYCQSPNTRVVDKRLSEDMKVNRRRRECLQCGKRFTTYERVDEVKLTIVKKEEIEEIVDEIEAELRQLGELEIEVNIVGEKVMEKLRGLDEVAYIRYASVYRRFTDIASFERELEKLRVVKEVDVKPSDSTELLLLVSGDTKEEISSWDRDKITAALEKEAVFQN